MKRFLLIAVGVVLMLVMTLVAQQVPPPADHAPNSPQDQRNADDGMPTVENHLKMLSEKLALSAGQQSQARPILQEMHDVTQKLMQTKKLSDQERTSKLRACHLRADAKLREILSDDQKQKLNQLEQDAHMDMHRNANATQH